MPDRYKGFFYPDDEDYDSPHRVKLAFEEVQFKSADDTQLSGWFIPAKGAESAHQAKGTVVHMHGNAQNMTTHWQFAQWLPSRAYNLFVFDYRGYGMSEGIPDPRGVFEDAIAALDYLRSRTDINTERLFVFGQSLGGMLAIAAASASPAGICAVLAEAPLHSYSMSVNDRISSLGATPELDDTYCASGRVADLSPIPLLLLHGTSDGIVPCSHSVALFEAAQQPKQLVMIENGKHIEAMTKRHGTHYQDLMIRFFEESALKS